MKVLFVCTGNSARSQMAEGFAHHYGGGRLEVSSAGVDPKGLHPLTIEVMAERGIDVSHQLSKALTDEMLRHADCVLNVCGHADRYCPMLPPHVEKVHWPIEDPAVRTGDPPPDLMAAFRKARDEIELRVREFLSTALKLES